MSSLPTMPDRSAAILVLFELEVNPPVQRELEMLLPKCSREATLQQMLPTGKPKVVLL